MNNVGNIIDRLGGCTAVARALDVNPSTVSEMKRRGSIRPSYWPIIIRYSQVSACRHVTAEELMNAHQANTAEVS